MFIICLDFHSSVYKMVDANSQSGTKYWKKLDFFGWWSLVTLEWNLCSITKSMIYTIMITLQNCTFFLYNFASWKLITFFSFLWISTRQLYILTNIEGSVKQSILYNPGTGRMTSLAVPSKSWWKRKMRTRFLNLLYPILVHLELFWVLFDDLHHYGLNCDTWLEHNLFISKWGHYNYWALERRDYVKPCLKQIMKQKL